MTKVKKDFSASMEQVIKWKTKEEMEKDKMAQEEREKKHIEESKEELKKLQGKK